MNRLAAILILIIGCNVTLLLHAQPLMVAWSPATNADGYVLFHANPGLFPDEWSVGNQTNFVLDASQLPAGANYFAVTAYLETPNGLAMSSYSNVAIVTNTPGFVVSFVTFTRTNLACAWSPLETNHLVVVKQFMSQFFITGSQTIAPTNIINGSPLH